MFEFIKKSLEKLFGSASGVPEKGRSGRDRKRKNGTRPEKSRNENPAPASGEPKKKKKGKKKSRENAAEAVTAAVASTAETARPQLPEKLADVPPEEGKMRFLDLPLHELVQFGIQHAGFSYCTPIQQMTLPALLENRDLAGKAQTGTGKTAAFLLASFTKLLNNPLTSPRKTGMPRMMILAPTRELAIQIHKDAENLGCFTGLTSVLLYGGIDHERQRRSLGQVVDIAIGTPGRVLDFLRGGDLNLSAVEILVIDEADRMLDMGFIPDVRSIVWRMPPKEKRQTLLFSATLDDSILRLAAGWLTEPVVVESEPEHPVSDNIQQTFYSVLRDDKLALLLYILRTMPYDRILIFGNRKDVNLRLQHDLGRYGFRVPVLSGDISQDKREKILEKFRSGAEKIVIATDVAARGIHVDDVSIVVNFDLPERPEDYIHRIGRTGRAGHTGVSISFLCEYGAYYLPAIEDLLHVQFPSILPEEEMLVLPEPVPGAAVDDYSAEHRDRRPHRGGKSRHRR